MLFISLFKNNFCRERLCNEGYHEIQNQRRQIKVTCSQREEYFGFEQPPLLVKVILLILRWEQALLNHRVHRRRYNHSYNFLLKHSNSTSLFVRFFLFWWGLFNINWDELCLLIQTLNIRKNLWFNLFWFINSYLNFFFSGQN